MRFVFDSEFWRLLSPLRFGSNRNICIFIPVHKDPKFHWLIKRFNRSRQSIAAARSRYFTIRVNFFHPAFFSKAIRPAVNQWLYHVGTISKCISNLIVAAAFRRRRRCRNVFFTHFNNFTDDGGGDRRRRQDQIIENRASVHCAPTLNGIPLPTDFCVLVTKLAAGHVR